MSRAIIKRNKNGTYDFVITCMAVGRVEEILCSSKQGYEQLTGAGCGLDSVGYAASGASEFYGRVTYMTALEYRTWRRKNLALKRKVEARRKRK